MQSFLSVWTGLEIFVNKAFKNYEKAVYRRFHDSENEDMVLSKFLERIQNVMKDKYRLTDKFSVVCYELDKVNADDDLEIFKDIKLVRDKLMHGDDIDISSLPIDKTRKLFSKYLKLALNE